MYTADVFTSPERDSVRLQRPCGECSVPAPNVLEEVKSVHEDDFDDVIQTLRRKDSMLKKELTELNLAVERKKEQRERVKGALAALTSNERKARGQTGCSKDEMLSLISSVLSEHPEGIRKSSLAELVKQRKPKDRSARGMHNTLRSALADDRFDLEGDIVRLRNAGESA